LHCPSGCSSTIFYPANGGGRTNNITNAKYLQVCDDRDQAWENGCEVALGYNLAVTTIGPQVYTNVSTASGTTTKLLGIYDRSIGVKPNWDQNFTLIDWGTGSAAGFDCEIVRLLPRNHTHVTPQNLSLHPIECAIGGKQGDGTCTFTCDPTWIDCDGNPWNGCEQSTILCTNGCQTATRYPGGRTLTCNTGLNNANALARPALCDGNQLPFDAWHLYYEDESGVNTDDASLYDDPFEIQDAGIDAVSVLTNYVDPVVSRYTIKGYWDNADIDYSCRVWLDSYDYNGYTLRTQNISSDANMATGRCVIDCLETGGYSNCDGNDLNGCESHKDTSSCRTTEGTCVNCVNIPGVILARCLSTTGSPAVPIKTFSVNWPTNNPGITGSDPYVVVYGSATAGTGIPQISTEFPQCDTRGQTALGLGAQIACDDDYCRDYDGDWENGCEFPASTSADGYTPAQRALWETQGALYQGVPSGGAGTTVFDGFDCSWIADPQPDAGGRNYGGKTWAQKYHVNTNTSNGGRSGACIGDGTLPGAGTCDIVCVSGWTDCDKDPSNGCENDNTLCTGCNFATRYSDGVLVDCTKLVDSTKGFIPFSILPTCNGREGEDGLCSHYMCDIFRGFCDSGLGKTLTTIGCINQTADNAHCGADWNWRALERNQSTVGVDDAVAEYDGGRMVDYSNFDGTGRCGNCQDLNGYVSNAVCEKDQTVAGHTFDKNTYYKPAASGWIDNSLGQISFNVAGNTVGDYLCQLHGEYGVDDDGACDRSLCVDEDYFWANGCETATGYNITLLKNGERSLSQTDDFEFGFNYHFAYNDVNFGLNWPYNAPRDGSPQLSDAVRSTIRGIWCPFLQFWSLSTDNYATGDCDVFPCPHFHKNTITNWVTCVNNATDPNAGKCNYQCNTVAGWKDCDSDPMTGCETDIFNDGTCGSGCERIECNALDGLNPFYWSECISNAGVSQCDLSICNASLCTNADSDWRTGCETAVNYTGGKTYNCRAIMNNSALMKARHLKTVEACVGETGNHWAGQCPFVCEHGWTDCNNDFADGCEHDGSLCQDCTKALGYVSHYDGANWWQFWGPADNNNKWFYTVVYGSTFVQDTLDLKNFTYVKAPFADTRGILHDQFAGPNVPYSKYHVPFVAAYDCAELRNIYPGQFTAANITCDSNAASPTAGRCIYACDASNLYFDCDGDPRNGCEHASTHEACGGSGACRNCYYISGVDYPVDKDGDGTNDGSLGPYGRGGINGLGLGLNDVYDDPQVKYLGHTNTIKDIPSQTTSPLRLGCIQRDVDAEFNCNLETCQVTGTVQVCKDFNQGLVPNSWRDGCERALGYNFNSSASGKYFDCNLMGPDAQNNDAPRPTNIPNTPSFHIRQVVGTIGCDSQGVNSAPLDPLRGKGAWRYILARTGRLSNETEGRYAFDYEGLVEAFSLNFDIDILTQNLGNLDLTVNNFVINRVRGDDKPGFCYYECEYGYEDCNGDPRDGCEILISACRDGNSAIGWQTDGCELALGYTRTQLGQPEDGTPATFPCTNVDAGNIVGGAAGVYCRGGQDGNLTNLGTCHFVCAAGWQDCDGQPGNGCEAPISDTNCDCISCQIYLPGTTPVDPNPNNGNFGKSNSVCNTALNQCTVPCNNTVCSNDDNDWTNGCEVAHLYQTPRGATPVGNFDCSIWAKNLSLALKQHIDINLLDRISCEGRAAANEAGTCSFQAACLQRSVGGLNDYQDCNNDPRDGCEDVNRWCTIGYSVANPRGTQSDRCSAALNYFRGPTGFDARDQFVESGVSRNIPGFDCYQLGFANNTLAHVNVTAVYPYCDRNPANLDTPGDCVFVCKTGWADCDGDARTGCEANVSLVKHCGYDCVNCDVLPGVDRLQPHGCIADATAGPASSVASSLARVEF